VISTAESLRRIVFDLAVRRDEAIQIQPIQRASVAPGTSATRGPAHAAACETEAETHPEDNHE
jgi:hypothetical protein